MSIFLRVEDQYENKVNGLCGDYNNGAKESDFLLRDLITYTKDSNLFSNDWKTDSSVYKNKISIFHFENLIFKFIFLLGHKIKVCRRNSNLSKLFGQPRDIRASIESLWFNN
jgi:hypothetical protein